MPNLHTSRGQTLILFALTMLLLVLMVCMTLSIGMKVRENHELQTLADATAYSNAVATARTYNNVSILNRLQVSAWVAQAGDQSYISWTSWARAAFQDAIDTADKLRADNQTLCNVLICCATATDALGNPYCSGYCSTDPGACTSAGQAGSVASQLRTKFKELYPPDEALWWQLDAAAGAESEAIQGVISGLRTASAKISGAEFQNINSIYNPPPDPSATNLRNLLGQGLMAKRVMQSAVPGFRTGELNLHNGTEVNAVNLREAVCNGFPLLPDGTGACKVSGTSQGSWSPMIEDAAMGTRLRAFTTGRDGLIPKNVQDKFNTVTNGTVTVFAHQGSGYWGTAAQESYGKDTYAAWGDDHDGMVTVGIPGPGGITSGIGTAARSHVLSDQEELADDEHPWSPGGLAHPNLSTVHTMAACTPFCDSVWVWPIGFQNGPDIDNDANGQPKNYSVLERDYLFGGRTASTGGGTNSAYDPWNLLFRFRFTPSETKNKFDNRGIRTSPQNGNLDISKAVAFGTAMAYYHRKNPDPSLSWKEFPNFLNPFWRATLVRANIDRQSKVDIPYILGAGNWQADSYKELLLVGFKGQH